MFQNHIQIDKILPDIPEITYLYEFQAKMAIVPLKK